MRHPASLPAVTKAPSAPAGSYPIGAVSRLTGVEPETLRMWERRYGLAPSARSGGGHRLYSERDVDVLRAVKVLLETGMRIGAVAALPAEQILSDARRVQGAARPAPILENNPQLLEQILEAALALDSERAAELLDRPRLFADGPQVARAVYVPLMHLVGERWSEGTLPVGVEHFTEKLVSTRLLSIFRALPDGHGPRALAACPPGERHEGGLIAAAIELRAAGFGVTLLGADLPVAELVRAAATADAKRVVMALTMEPPELVARALKDALQRPPLRSLPLVLGGRAAESFARRLERPATVCASIADVVEAARG